MNDTQTFRLIRIDWRWLVVTYCFLVLFHLLPSHLELTLRQLLHASVMWQSALWIAVGVTLVSAYVGYRSRSAIILESGFAAMLYMATLIALLSKVRDFHASGYRLIGLLVALHLIAFLVGCFGAAVGRWIQSRRERVQGISENL